MPSNLYKKLFYRILYILKYVYTHMYLQIPANLAALVQLYAHPIFLQLPTTILMLILVTLTSIV
jgi:hypothetical protein